MNRTLAVLAMVAAGCDACDIRAAEVTYRVLISSGQEVPGLPGVTFDAGPVNPSTSGLLNSQGRFILNAFTSGSGQALVAGDFRASDPGLQVVLRRNQTIPGLNSGIALFAYTPEMNMTADGRFIIGGGLTGTGITGTNGRVWLVQPSIGGPVAVLARPDDPAPGLAGVQYGFFESLESLPGMNASGTIAFTTRLTGLNVTSSNDTALWRSSISSPAASFALAREGMQVAGQPPGVAYGEFSAFNQPVVTPEGDILLVSDILDPAAPGGRFQALLRFPAASTAPETLARTGQSISGVTPTTLGWPGIVNGSGALALIAQSSTGGAALLVGSSPGVSPFRVVAAPGDPAPGLSPLVFGSVSSFAFMLGADNRATFQVSLSPGVGLSLDTALYSETASGLELIIREGIAGAPPLPAGVSCSTFSPAGRTSRGDTLFTSSLTGTGVTTSNDQALILAPASGGPQLLLREGSPFTVAPGDVRTVRTLDFRYFRSSSPINTRREFLTSMSFTNSTRIYAVVSIDPCRGDFNNDGAATLQDLFDFLGAWFASGLSADFDRSGSVSLQDLLDFLGAWFAPCS